MPRREFYASSMLHVKAKLHQETLEIISSNVYLYEEAYTRFNIIQD